MGVVVVEKVECDDVIDDLVDVDEDYDDEC